MNPVSINGADQDFGHVLACVPTLDLLKWELFRFQFPVLRAIGRCIDVVPRNRQIWISRFGRPCIKRKRNLTWKVLKFCANLLLCNKCTTQNIRTKSGAMWYITVRDWRSAVLDETAKTTTVDQTECLGGNEWTCNINIVKVSYLVFAYDKLNNVVKKACSRKWWLLGFTSYDAVQTRLVKAFSWSISTVLIYHPEGGTDLSLLPLGIWERARECGTIPNVLQRSR